MIFLLNNYLPNIARNIWTLKVRYLKFLRLANIWFFTAPAVVNSKINNLESEVNSLAKNCGNNTKERVRVRPFLLSSITDGN